MLINIVTPCSRIQNLQAISESINIPKGSYKWFIVFDSDTIPDIEKGIDASFYAVKNGDSISGNSQRNAAIDLINDGYVLFLDDDTILHQDLWEEVNKCEEDIISWMQCLPNGRHRLNSGIYEVGCIDSGSFMVKREIIGDLRWDIGKYDADGYFAKSVARNTKSQRRIDKYLSYYNFLRQ